MTTTQQNQTCEVAVSCCSVDGVDGVGGLVVDEVVGGCLDKFLFVEFWGPGQIDKDAEFFLALLVVYVTWDVYGDGGVFGACVEDGGVVDGLGGEFVVTGVGDGVAHAAPMGSM